MKYVDRKTTPLKWNTILKVGLPFLILYDLFSMITGVKQLIDDTGTVATSLRSIGLSLQNMETLFWPISLGMIESFLSMVLLIYACIGLWKWEKYGIRCFLSAIALSFASSIAQVVCINFMPLYRNFLLVGMNQYSAVVKNIYIATFIMSAIIYFIIFSLSAIYYRKREILFDSYYTQPQSTENIVSQNHTEIAQADINSELFEPFYCPECGMKIEEKDVHFCPNCGRKL